MIYGLHISNANLLETIKKYYSKHKATCFQFFLSNPRKKINKISKEKLKEAKEIKKYVEENKISLYTHTPYTLNIARNPEKKSYWVTGLIKELEIADKFGIKGCVLHLGKSLDQKEKESYKNMKKCLEEVIKKTKNIKTKILLETSSGQGTELGWKLEDFSDFYKSFDKKNLERLSICIDTCHIFSAGYDIRTREGVINIFEKFEKLFGIKNIELIHYNDSKRELGSRVDRHQYVGHGNIGDGLKFFSWYSVKYDLPLLFEMPHDNFNTDLKLLIKWLSNKDKEK